jgi:hypothetical protein
MIVEEYSISYTNNQRCAIIDKLCFVSASLKGNNFKTSLDVNIQGKDVESFAIRLTAG